MADDLILWILWIQYLSSQRPEKKLLSSAMSNIMVGMY